MEDNKKVYHMPFMTEQRKEEIIEDLEEQLEEETHSLYGYAARISLAVLTAEPVVWIKPDCLGFPRIAQIDAVTIPFVPEYPVPLFLEPPVSLFNPIELPEPSEKLSENEKEAYRLIIKQVEESLEKQGYKVKNKG